MIISSANEGLSRRTRRAHNQFSEFIKGSSASQVQRTHADFSGSPSTSKASNKKRGKQGTAAAELETFDAPAANAIATPVPRKRRKAATNPVPQDTTKTIPSAEPTLDPSESISAQSHDRTTRSSRRLLGPSTAPLPAAPDLPPKPRKVILRVTQPESALDQLLKRSQEPLPPLPTGLNHKKVAVISELRAHAEAAAVLAGKRAELQRGGWYLPLDRNGERRRGPPEEPERRGDTWDVILKAVEAVYRPEPLHIAVTRRVCEAVRARTELSLCGQVAQSRLMRGTIKAKGPKKQKDDPETARLKELAKATVDLVINQWKRVVLASVIRGFWVARVHSCEFFVVCPRETEGRGGGRGEKAGAGTP